MWAAILGVVAVIAFVYEFMPFFTGSATPASSAQAAAPVIPAPKAAGRAAAKIGKKFKVENLDPTLRLDLLAASEKTQYQGNGRKIFVSQNEDVVIQRPVARPNTD